MVDYLQALCKETEWLVRGHPARCRKMEKIYRTLEGIEDLYRRQRMEAELRSLPEMRKIEAVRHALRKYPDSVGEILLKNIVFRIPMEAMSTPLGMKKMYGLRREFLLRVARRMGYISTDIQCSTDAEKKTMEIL